MKEEQKNTRARYATSNNVDHQIKKKKTMKIQKEIFQEFLKVPDWLELNDKFKRDRQHMAMFCLRPAVYGHRTAAACRRWIGKESVKTTD